MQNIPAKKSLGQNWLKSKGALLKMLEAGEVTGKDIILEVGPGKGALTEKLLEKASKVIAVEKDDRLIEFLKEKFAVEITANKLEIIHGDILDFNPANFKLTAGNYKLIANIPYYITGQFLRKFLESDYQPERIVVMVQKEIAQRIIANNPEKQGEKKESLLSISVKAFGTPKIVMKVGKENFSPAPKVDSAILLISNISKKLFVLDGQAENKVTEEKFFKILHAGFAHKRKILMGNLKEGIEVRENLEEIFNVCKIPLKARAEELSIEDWVRLCQKLN